MCGVGEGVEEHASSTTSHEVEKWLRLKGSGFAITKWTPLAAKMHVNIQQTF